MDASVRWHDGIGERTILSVRAELVEAPSSSEKQGFDRLSPNGRGVQYLARTK
jgi:hypothetical protein